MSATRRRRACLCGAQHGRAPDETPAQPWSGAFGRRRSLGNAGQASEALPGAGAELGPQAAGNTLLACETLVWGAPARHQKCGQEPTWGRGQPPAGRFGARGATLDFNADRGDWRQCGLCRAGARRAWLGAGPAGQLRHASRLASAGVAFCWHARRQFWERRSGIRNAARRLARVGGPEIRR